jgi:hypothetical protein
LRAAGISLVIESQQEGVLRVGGDERYQMGGEGALGVGGWDGYLSLCKGWEGWGTAISG